MTTIPCVTRKIAIDGQHSTFYHRTERNADGTAVRCRVNGKCKIWKTRPNDYRLPVKHGLKQCFYLTHRNSDVWLLEDPTGIPRARPECPWGRQPCDNPACANTCVYAEKGKRA